MNKIQALDELWKRKTKVDGHEIEHGIPMGEDVSVTINFTVSAKDFVEIDAQYEAAKKAPKKSTGNPTMPETKPTNLKPFDASKFVSNEKTPVVDMGVVPVHILSMQGRGEFSVVGYAGNATQVGVWEPAQLRFAPVKRTVEVEIYKTPNGELRSMIMDPVYRAPHASWTFVSTIKCEVEA